MAKNNTIACRFVYIYIDDLSVGYLKIELDIWESAGELITHKSTQTFKSNFLDYRGVTLCNCTCISSNFK